MKVKKWIDTPELSRYEAFVNDWHNFLVHMEERAQSAEDVERKQISMFILQNFYIKPYDCSIDFYQQYEARRKEAGLIFHV